MAKKRKDKSNVKILISVFILLISFIFFLIALNMNSILILQKQEIPVSVRVSDYAAWNISKNESMLNLGIIKRGTSAERNIQISNNYTFPVIVAISVKGDITPLLIFDRIIYMEPRENKDISISTKVIEGEEFGNYTGMLIVTLKKKLF
jgi:hypothetical protein